MILRLQCGLLFVISLAHAAPPALPFFDWGACPFEGCSYGTWIATREVTVYTSLRRNRKPIAHLQRGETVTALRGVVITYRPSVIRMDRDLPEQKLKRGERILTYAYGGEGYSAAWVHGQYNRAFDISFAGQAAAGETCEGPQCVSTYVDLGKKSWWALVRLKSGSTGWVKTDGGAFDM